MALVSIITPVYNAATTLSETLATVREQTFEDWEQILVDDGSTDESLAIAEEAAWADSRLRLLRTLRNSGPAAARNVALDVARGRFIAFLDADDLWLPDKLELCVKFMTTHNFSFIYHDYRHISHDGSCVGALISGSEKLDFYTLHTRRGHGCLSVVIDRQIVPWFRFPMNCRGVNEDFRAWLSLIQQGHVGHRLSCDLGRYRLSKKSRSSNKAVAVIETWKIYRNESGLPLMRAAHWWIRYAWNAFWLHLYSRPR